jgi:hypothetical protein
MKIKDKCPICDSNLDLVYRDTMGHTLLEEHQECWNCGRYSYTFVTGNIRYQIGTETIEFEHNQPTPINKIKAAEDKARKDYETH